MGVTGFPDRYINTGSDSKRNTGFPIDHGVLTEKEYLPGGTPGRQSVHRQCCIPDNLLVIPTCLATICV